MLHTDRFHDYVLYIFKYQNQQSETCVMDSRLYQYFKSFLPVSFYFTFDFLFLVKAFHKIEIWPMYVYLYIVKCIWG